MRATERGHCTHAQQETATWPFQTIPLSSNVKMKKKKKSGFTGCMNQWFSESMGHNVQYTMV